MDHPPRSTSSDSVRHRPRPTRQQIARVVVAILVPPAAVLAAIHSEPLGETAAQHPGLLALAILTVALALCFQPLRRLLLVVLAYAAALMALLGMYRARVVGPPVQLAALSGLYSLGWAVVFAMAAAAGTTEIIRPRTVLAKRLLFGAGAVFLIGHGVVGLVTMPNSLSLAALIAGLCSLVAAFLAHRLVLPAPPPSEEDPLSAAALAEARHRRLRDREWRDTARGGTLHS